MIRKNEYAWTRERKVVLDSGLIRRFLELLERIFQVERPYKFKHGIKRRDGLSMCQEITIARYPFKSWQIIVLLRKQGLLFCQIMAHNGVHYAKSRHAASSSSTSKLW
jgi:hypothetical protein